MPVMGNAEFFDALKILINAWCDRRALLPLAQVLPAYTAFNGMTDGWGEMLKALKNVRAFCRDELAEPEIAAVADLIRAVEQTLHC